MRTNRLLLGLIAVALDSSVVGASADGVTLTPDARIVLASRIRGAERWTIHALLDPVDRARIVSVTGTVSRTDGGTPSFVVCTVLPGSQTFADENGGLILACKGAGNCLTTAEQCSQTNWSTISDDVRVPISFFLPAGTSKISIRGPESQSSETLSTSAARVAVTNRGATWSPDRTTHLVTKAIGADRWSIVYRVEANVAEGEARPYEVTGMINPAGEAPARFVACREREDSRGTLSDPQSTLRFSCLGADPCTSDLSTCGASDWRTISNDVGVPASFFLPPGGLSPTDPDTKVVVLPTGVGLPTIVASPFTAEFPDPGGGCPVGSFCIPQPVGTCADLLGTVIESPEIGCGCRVAGLSHCVSCPADAAGNRCSFAVGNETLDGTCLPTTSLADDIACHAKGSSGEEPVLACDQSTSDSCRPGGCCVTDPRSDCPVGDSSCPGICVSNAGCPAGVPCSCMQCLDLGTTCRTEPSRYSRGDCCVGTYCDGLFPESGICTPLPY